jgi:DNA-binding IclR family transcriptional regulator
MAGTTERGPDTVPHSQTLDRGVRLLETLAAASQPLSIAQLAERLGVHRSVAYRILRTLEDHQLVSRNGDGRCELGVGISVLAGAVRSTLQTAALPELSDLANDLGMTAFLVVEDRGDAVTVLSVEPRHSSVHVAYRPGVRHPVDRGAPGIALLAGREPQAGERPEVAEARARGWARTCGEVLPGMSSVSVPLLGRSGDVVASVAVVYVDHGVDPEPIADRILTAAEAIHPRLS